MLFELEIVCFSVGGGLLLLLIVVLLASREAPQEDSVNRHMAEIDRHLTAIRRRSDEQHAAALLHFPTTQSAPWEDSGCL